MANRRMEFMIGMTVLVVFATIIIMTILFGSNRTSLFQFKQGQKMSIVFDKAPGIKNTSRVTKSGIEIGRVVRTDLIDEEGSSRVRVYFTLDDPNVHIYSNEQARIKPSLLMGEAEIEFVKNHKYDAEIREMTPNDSITGISGSDIMGTVSNIEGDLKDAIQSINVTAQEAARFIENLNSFMGTEPEIKMKKERMNAIFNSLGETLETTRSLATNINGLLSDPQIRENIQRGAEDFPNILNKIDTLLDNGEDLYHSVKDAVGRSHTTFDKLDRSLDNIQDFTQVLSDDGQEFISNMNASSQDITKMVKNISNLSENIVKQIDNKQTPLGMLTDEEVGREVRGIVRNVEAASEKVQPILDDARVFTNKIAHRPSALVFSRDTYKGAPALGNSRYSYQPYSPAGGISSQLWTETRRRAPSPSAGSAYYPDSLESFRATHPETYSELRRQRPMGNCLSGTGLFGKGPGGQDAESAEQGGYVSDPGVYYGLEGVVPVEGYSADGYYPGPMPVSDENEMDVPCGGLRGMKFSLTRAFHKAFGGKDETAAPACPLKPQVPPGVPMIGSLYGSDGWSAADGIPAETISWAPSYGGDDVSVFDGGCAVPSCETPSCDIPNCDAPACDLGGAPMTFGSTQDVSAPSPNRSDYGPMESPLPPRPSEKPKTEVPSAEPKAPAEELPSSAVRPGDSKKNAYQASGMAPGYSNSAAPIGLPSPVKSRSRNFVDDGLPLRFTPND